MTQEERQLLSSNPERIAFILGRAVACLIDRDSYLLENDLKEEAINHRLAVYLELGVLRDQVLRRFRFSVDSEYDRFGADPKSVPKPFPPEDVPEEEQDALVRPDIIVHQRGSSEGQINLLAIEVKKRVSATPTSKVRAYALWKCEAYRTSTLAYLFSAYVSLRTGPRWDKAAPLAEFILFPAASSG